MDNKDIVFLYENQSSIKAPPPIRDAFIRVITELYDITLLYDEFPTEEFNDETYLDVDANDPYETVDDMIRAEHYQALLDEQAEWQLSREDNESSEY